MKYFRRIYDWVLSWSDSPYGVPALFLLAVAESSIFPVPPDVLLIALALSAPRRAYRLAAVTTLGSVIGGAVGYALGWGFWGALEPYFFHYVPGVSAHGFEQVRQLFDQYGFWTIFAAGFTPIPYKIFTISAGIFQISFPIFMLASVIGRGLRFFLVAALFFHFGKAAREIIERYFNLFSILLLIAIIVIVVLAKTLM